MAPPGDAALLSRILTRVENFFHALARMWAAFIRRLRLLTVRQAVSLGLLLVGGGLLSYVVEQYASMHLEQQRLSRQWLEQNRAGALPPPEDALHDSLIKVRIPRIDLDAIVVEGTSYKQLLLGPGHMAGTPRPGESGNSVITAHRDTFFRHIYELNKGDQIEVRRNGLTYTYTVTGKKVTDPHDLSVLRQTREKRLTLITCYPTYFIGPAPERLVIFSKLIEPETQTSAAGAGE